MVYTVIHVPDKNDSVSRVVLNGTAYYIRFTYNDTSDRWYFGLYDAQMAPIIQGVKVVPGFPLNLFKGSDSVPDGVFGCFSDLDAVGRNAFREDKAQFIFVPAEEELS